MATMVLHKAGDRFHVQTERSDSYFSFSFGDLYREDRLGFGALRVLNDDVVSPGAGFGSHPHDNMEIITIMVSGEITHHDSLENEGVARPGRLQIISAGSGIFHSEYNRAPVEAANNLQIWVYPNQLNTPPAYNQADYIYPSPLNAWQVILEPIGGSVKDSVAKIRQDSWFSLGRIGKGKNLRYPVKRQGNGIYIFVIEGMLTIQGQVIGSRDGLGIAGVPSVDVLAEEDAELLVIEVPMNDMQQG